MGLHPRLGGIVYGFGLFQNGLFWLAAAAMAYYAIRLGNVPVRRTAGKSLCGTVFWRNIIISVTSSRWENT